jgi:hypothetical protein
MWKQECERGVWWGQAESGVRRSLCIEAFDRSLASLTVDMFQR